MDKKKHNAKRQNSSLMETQELQKAVIEYRQQIPNIYGSLLRKEREIINKNLKETKFNIESKANVEIQPIQKSLQNLNLDMERYQQNESKMIQLNSKVDDLLKCMEYIKK